MEKTEGEEDKTRQDKNIDISNQERIKRKLSYASYTYLHTYTEQFVSVTLRQRQDQFQIRIQRIDPKSHHVKCGHEWKWRKFVV